MAQYIDKAAASSACNTQRAYGTMEIIQQLPAAKVVDKEQFNRACERVAREEKREFTNQGKFEGRQEYIDSLSNFDLLIIDDLAAERNTEFVNEIVFSVIDARYRTGLPLIITTNVAARAMAQEKEQDRQRIYSRVLEMCHPIEVSGTDRRKQAAVQDYAEMQRLLGI